MVPEEHGEAHHRPLLAGQLPGGHRGVEAAAHGHGDQTVIDLLESHATALRSSATSRASAPRKASTSAIVLPMPKLTRREERASSREIPAASRVLLGSTLPEEQAAPGETAKPARSSRISSDSPSTPVNATFEVLGRRRDPWQWTIAPGTWVGSAASKRSRRAARWAVRCAISSRAAAAAAPRPTMAGTFSVLARRRRSWLPPTRWPEISTPLRTQRAAAPSGP